jgi:ComF family protein
MKPQCHPSFAERLDSLVDWLYPPRCRACSESIQGCDREYFCSACWPQIQLVAHPFCTICGRPFPDSSGDDHVCGVCLARNPQYARAHSWACYPREEATEHPLRQVIQKFKYGRKVALGKPLGRLMARGCEEFLLTCKAEIIIPVPLHPRRLRWRGFNQSVLLARQIGRAYNLPLNCFALYRKIDTPPQTQLPEEERRKNMRGAFALSGKTAVRGKCLLLVDDVYTSGATVNECSRVLKQGGAREVSVLTLARAVY